MSYLDTRDLYTRKNELEDLKTAFDEAKEALADHLASKPEIEGDEPSEEMEAWEEERENLEDARDAAALDFGDEEAAELAELEEIESEVSDFRHGETMVPVNQFEEYARELADDLGAIDSNARWPLTCIDWEQAARELAMDYTEVTYQGTSYYIRA